jgi:CPA2 family monovalent cation:H+ antiporter-2
MPQHLDLIFTLTGGLVAAVLFGLVTQRLRLSPIVGYLLAGIAVGPFTPGFVAHGEIATQLADLGVILLLFGVGLHFHLDELLAVRRVALPGALLQIAVATAAGAAVARGFGWSLGAAVIFGLAISVASTVVLLRVLSDNDALHTRAGHVAVGWLLVEDMFTVLALVLLPIAAGETAVADPIVIGVSVVKALAKIGLLVFFTLVVGRKVIPRLLSYVARTGSRELFTLTVLVLALGIAVGSAQLFGTSMALGAFLAGLVIGQSDFASRAAEEALPMRDAFAVLFFVSMGMLLDPREIWPNIGRIGATFALIVLVKPLATLVIALALRAGAETAASVSVALAQIGEFSFILAEVGRRLGLLPEEATQTLVSASIASITLNPLLYRLVPWGTRSLGRLGARLRHLAPSGDRGAGGFGGAPPRSG